MLGSPRLLQLVKFAILFLFAVWLLKSAVSYRSTYEGVARHFQDEKESFIADFLSHEVDGEFDGHDIAELCAAKPWEPNLILSCDPPAGGLVAVKNAHLNCLRIAMEMGAGFIAPSIIKRDKQNLGQLKPYTGKGPVRGEPFDYLFDFNYLNRTLHSLCPQMKLYKSIDDLYDVPSVMTAENINLKSFNIHIKNKTVISDPSDLSPKAKTYIDKVSPPENRTRPIRFHLAVTNWAFPTSSDGPAVERTFGRLIRAREDARHLSAVALYNLQKRHGLEPNPARGPMNKTVTGVHLRTEIDSDWSFPKFDNQAEYLLDYIKASKAKIVFLSTGASEAHTSKFAGLARDLNTTIVLKTDLLEGGDLEKLNSLSYDQKALVDHEIMLRVGLAAGSAHSAFDWDIALRRANLAGASDPAPRVNTSAGIAWQDGRSTIFGVADNSYRQTIWP
ncbi:hypothetical protein OQA88_3586 [Cercophora sp. LCS_1]